MKGKLIIGVIFGAAAGGLGTYIFLKEKFFKQTQDEVAEAREHYKKAMEDFVDDMARSNVEDPVEKYAENDAKVLEEVASNYISEEVEEKVVSKPKKKGGRKKKVTSDAIVISSDEFVELNGYDKITLYFFGDDKVFTNTEYEVQEDGLAMVGEDNLDCTSLYEDEVLYVRSDTYGADYEVIFKDCSYREFMEEN